MAERPRVYRAEGIVLRRRNIGEADSIFTVFSDEIGKFEGIAKGVRKARSHMRGHLEPLTHSRMLLARGRSLDVFTQAETVQSFRGLRDDLDRTAAGLACAELVDRFTAIHVEQPGLFALLSAVLEAIAAGAPLHLVRFFELHLLTMTGYELHLDGCALCGARLPEAETLLSADAGGLVCLACRGQAGGGRILSVRGVKVVRYARTATPGQFAALTISSGLAHELEAAMRDLVRHFLEREPHMGRYIDDLARLPAAHPSENGDEAVQ